MIWLQEELFANKKTPECLEKEESKLIPYSKYLEMMKEKGESLEFLLS